MAPRTPLLAHQQGMGPLEGAGALQVQEFLLVIRQKLQRFAGIAAHARPLMPMGVQGMIRVPALPDHATPIITVDSDETWRFLHQEIDIGDKCDATLSAGDKGRADQVASMRRQAIMNDDRSVVVQNPPGQIHIARGTSVVVVGIDENEVVADTAPLGLGDAFRDTERIGAIVDGVGVLQAFQIVG